MANDKRKVYFSALTVRKMLSNEREHNKTAIKSDFFDQVVENYKKAQTSGEYKLFQKSNDGGNTVLMISSLHYEGNILCGIVGRCSRKVNRFLRERNPETFGTKALTSSAGNLFEEYTYFAISPEYLKLAFLNNDAVSSNIPRLVTNIMQQCAGNSIYYLEVDILLDRDIKSKLKNMNGNIQVNGTISGQERRIIGGMPSLKRIEETLGTRFQAKLKISGRINKNLSDDEIDQITQSATIDEGFESFSFSESIDEEKEVIDIIKKQAYLSRTIQLTEAEREQSDVIWSRIRSCFN